ncbi:hypothetical protein BC829DRAFT_41935 [Chytridium lagenaria]|nr:hypothetical protein BC829DRAFT_41935 [Chytridium lagenaria]
MVDFIIVCAHTSSTSATVTSSVTSSAAPSSSWASTSTVAKIPVKAFNSNPCWKAPANAMACTGKSTFNLCLANGGFASSTSQTCAGAGTVCCASTGRCEFLDDCDVLDTNPCAGVPNNGVKITGPSTYNYCIDGVFVKSVDNSCPAGYVACSWADGCVPAGYCGPDFTYEPSTGPTSSASVSSTATAPVNPIFTNPPGAPGSCAGVADGQIACLTSNTFNICQNGNLAPALPQSCQLAWCAARTTVFATTLEVCTFVGPINPISPPALTCTGQIDGTPVCTSTNTFNFCIGGAILTRFADQSCGLGTVCCAATGRCDFATNCPSIGNNPVVPVVTTTVTTNPGVPTAPPAPPALVASCAGKVDGSTVCTGAFSFNQCIDGSIIRNTPDQPCPGGTVCCVATGRCDFAFSCPAVAPPNPVSPPVTTVPSVPVTTTVPNVPIVPVSCGDRADGSPICTGSNSFNYCVNGRILPFTADQPCPPGTVCCAVSGTCGLAGGCVVATAPPAPVVPTVVPPPPTNLCAGKTDGAVVCVSETSLNFCIAGNVLTTSAQPCPGSTVCCPSLGVCVNRGECPDPVNPPATTVAPPVQTSGPVSAESVPFVPRSCVNIPDNEIVCTGDLTFNYCSAGLVIVDTPDQYCAGGTVCCGVLRKCVRPSECPIPNPCTSKVDGSLICTSENTFNLCSFGSLSRAPDQQCAPGTVCCPSTGTCDRIASCTPLPPSPPPTTTTRPPPPAPSTNAPSPTPIKLGDCTGKIEGETVCVGPLSLGRCSGGRLVDGPSQPCALGTICCPERGICELSANCPSSRPRPLPRLPRSPPLLVLHQPLPPLLFLFPLKFLPL